MRSRWLIRWQTLMDTRLSCFFGAHKVCEGCACDCHYRSLFK